MNTAIIIQARTSSSRLPNKVLLKIYKNQSVLEFLIERLKELKDVADVIVATTNEKEDNVIEELCKKMKIKFYRGSKDDVFARYLECAENFNVDSIVRVCADCPLVDLNGIRDLIVANKKNPQADLIHNKHAKGYPFGMGAELVTFDALKKVSQSRLSPFHKEHVLPFIFENQDKFKVIKVNAPAEVVRNNYYLSLDYSEDFKMLKELVGKVKIHERKELTAENITKFLDENNAIANINFSIHKNEKYLN